MNTTNFKKETNFKKWAFRFLVYLIFINIAAFYLGVNFANGFDNLDLYESKMTILSLLGTILLLAGIIFTILSVTKKEKKNYQYYISLIGYPLFLIVTILSMVLG